MFTYVAFSGILANPCDKGLTLHVKQFLQERLRWRPHRSKRSRPPIPFRQQIADFQPQGDP